MQVTLRSVDSRLLDQMRQRLWTSKSGGVSKPIHRLLRAYRRFRVVVYAGDKLVAQTHGDLGCATPADMQSILEILTLCVPQRA